MSRRKKAPRVKMIVKCRGGKAIIKTNMTYEQCADVARALYRQDVNQLTRDKAKGFFHKLWRFLHKLPRFLIDEIADRMESAFAYHEQVHGDVIRPIGLIEERNTYERVFEMGADK